MADAHASTNPDAHGLASALAPALVEATGGRLGSIEWFRSPHQRGGASTAFCTYADHQGRTLPAVLKVPVGPAEYRWTTELSRLIGTGGPVPSTVRVLAHGTSVGGADLAWLVLERLQGHTLHDGWCRESLEDLVRACAAMQAGACRVAPEITRPAESPDWERQIARAREVARASGLPEAQHWNESVKKVQRALPHLAGLWARRPIDSWCHGDLHPGNAMHRAPGADGAEGGEGGEGGDRGNGCVLIDLALVHAGHWVEDAIYLERQFWGKPELLFGVHTVSLMARHRRDLGLRTDGDYGLVANLRRVLMAACAPAHVAAEGNPRYLHAALETIDRVLPQVAHAH